MKRDPQRLLDALESTQVEREMLEAGRAVSPVRYDVASGAARLHAALHSTAVGGAVSGASVGVAGKVTVALLIAGAASIGYVALQAPADTKTEAAPSPVTASAPSPRAEVEAPRAEPTTRAPAPTAASSPASVEAAETSDERRSKRWRPVRQSGEAQRRTSQPAVARNAPAPAHEQVEHEHEHEHEARAPEPEPAPTPRAETTAPAEAARPAEPDTAADHVNELRTIARARKLVTHDPAQALALLRRLEREHPRGYFVEERQALIVIALAQLGQDDEAARRGKAFLRAYPHSPHAGQVRGVLAE